MEMIQLRAAALRAEFISAFSAENRVAAAESWRRGEGQAAWCSLCGRATGTAAARSAGEMRDFCRCEWRIA